jgi:hypothetical protein
MIGSRLFSEAVLAFLETMRRLLDVSGPNDSFSINGVDFARDFGIKRVL